MPLTDDEDLAPPSQDYISEWKPQDGPRFRLADLISRGARKVGDFLAEKPPGIGYTPGDLANDMVVRPLQRTAERVAYGENPFFTGRGQTTRLRDDMVDTAMNVAPFAGALSRPFRMGAQAIERAVPMEAGKLYSGIPTPTPAISMSEALAPQKTTLRTLENLPNKAKVSKATIEQQLARPEVTKSEKDVMEKVLAKHGDTVSADALVKDVAKETEKFGLAAKDSDEYADYGLGRIGRDGLDGVNGDMYAARWAELEARGLGPEEAHAAIEKEFQGPQNIRTTQWELPVSHGDIGNHFGNPKYFGHTRAFEQDGIPHVVEIQSDLAQKGPNFKPLSAEERSGLESQIEDLATKRTETQRAISEASTAQETGLLRNRARELSVKQAELESKLNASQAPHSINPMLKNWDRRLIREELSRAAQRQEQLKNLRIDESDTAATHASANPVVRFADADTVAAVEGWPKVDPLREAQTKMFQAEDDYLRAQDQVAFYREMYSESNRADGTPFSAAERAAQQESMQRYENSMEKSRQRMEDAKSRLEEAQKNPPKTQFSPEHQGIYDRYKKDVEKYLKQLGGMEYVDDKGHRWIEVPVKPSHKRTQLFNVGAGAGAAGAAGAAATNKEAPQGGL